MPRVGSDVVGSISNDFVHFLEVVEFILKLIELMLK